MNIVAFGASASKKSINKIFAHFVAQQFKGMVDLLDLNDYPLPLYTVDIEQEIGIPIEVKVFDKKLERADLIVISLAEHNGTYTAVFKNLFDWVSRHRLKMFEGKNVVLVSTAPGGRGGKGVMDAALVRFPIHGATILGHFSLPKFYENFSIETGIIDEALKNDFNSFIQETEMTIAKINS